MLWPLRGEVLRWGWRGGVWCLGCGRGESRGGLYVFLLFSLRALVSRLGFEHGGCVCRYIMIGERDMKGGAGYS